MPRLFTTENTEGTERTPEEKKRGIFSVRSVLFVVNLLFDCDVRREWQPCF